MSTLKTVYIAHGDGGERGSGPVIGVFSTEYDAEYYAKGRGWYGGDGYVCNGTAVNVGNEWYLLASPAPVDIDLKKSEFDEMLRQETLATLTDDQKRVLGLT